MPYDMPSLRMSLCDVVDVGHVAAHGIIDTLRVVVAVEELLPRPIDLLLNSASLLPSNSVKRLRYCPDSNAPIGWGGTSVAV